MPQAINKLAVTIPVAVEMTGISRPSIYKLFAEGRLTRRKYGKRSLILVEDLEQFIRSLPVAA